MKIFISTLLCFGLAVSSGARAQGEDSHPADRDMQVISTMLLGGYDNANQSYFDVRGKNDVKHRRVHMTVDSAEMPSVGDNLFKASAYWDNDTEEVAGNYVFSLSANHDVGAVQMRVWTVDSFERSQLTDGTAACDMFWRREAAQFRATADSNCDQPLFTEMVLAEKEFWVEFGDIEDGGFKMHRTRNFECYADIPGVGGGRDEAYERYEDFKIHDQGGDVWFTANDGRKLGISLFLVDWPINNYAGIFTRDSFVIYVSEEIDGVKKEHGYAFTVPDADRIGINLKWMLASCFMQSNKYATPYM